MRRAVLLSLALVDLAPEIVTRAARFYDVSHVVRTEQREPPAPAP